ncbi:MAG: hypothetical protein M0Z61_16470 [Nitrospiraceae bacterium]|nr:hypothetical protein [Nitrospiraceae bacterium]
MSYYIHSVPGRLRVKSPLVKNNQIAAVEVEKLLNSLYGVNSVLANVVTGSITVNYDQNAVTSDSIIDILKNTGYFEPSKAISHDQYINRAASKAGQAIGRSIAGLVVGKALEGSALSLLTFLI